jgi:hypothetical protein
MSSTDDFNGFLWLHCCDVGLGWSIHGKYSRGIERGKMIKNFVVENKIKIQPSEFQSFQIEHSKTLSISQERQRRYTLRKATLYTLNEIDEVFDTWIPYNGIILDDGSHICYKRTPQYVTITRGETSKENTNSLSRSRYNAINMIIKRQVMTQSDTEITVRVMMGDCNAVDEINVISE